MPTGGGKSSGEMELIMKAQKTGFVMYSKYSNEVEYEYRGYKYFVEFPTGMTYGCTSPKLQHEIEQEKIDRMIEEEKKPRQPNETETCDYALDMFFKMIED